MLRAMATREQIDELFEKIEQERSALLDTLSSVGEAEAEMRPPEGDGDGDADGEAGWSVKEQLTHLAGMDRMYRQWVIRALAEDRPDTSDGRTPSVPLDIPHERAHAATVAGLVAQMGAERAETLRLARAIDPEQYERTAIVAAFGELTVMQWLRSYYRHDRMHRAQICGEDSDYQPRFAEGHQEAPPR